MSFHLFPEYVFTYTKAAFAYMQRFVCVYNRFKFLHLGVQPSHYCQANPGKPAQPPEPAGVQSSSRGCVCVTRSLNTAALCWPKSPACPPLPLSPPRMYSHFTALLLSCSLVALCAGERTLMAFCWSIQLYCQWDRMLTCTIIHLFFEQKNNNSTLTLAHVVSYYQTASNVLQLIVTVRQ